MRRLLLDLRSLSAGSLDRWRELADSADEGNPFFEPEFALPAAAALPAGAPKLLVAVDEGGEWLAALPVSRRRWHRLPVSVLASWTHLYCFWGGPVARPGSEAAALRTWIEPSRTGDGPLFGLDLLYADSAWHRALDGLAAEGSARVTVLDEHERAALRRKDGRFDMGLSAKRRRENDRLRRRLSERLGAEVEVRDRSADPTAVEDFLRLEAAGWKGRAGTAMACDPAHAELLRRACEGFRSRGRLSMLSLEANGTVAAIKCSFLAGDTAFCFKTAFDETLGDFSPGVQLARALADQMQDERRIESIDTCADPRNGMANRVWPQRLRLVSLAVARPDLGGRVASTVVQALALVRKLGRRTP